MVTSETRVTLTMKQFIGGLVSIVLSVAGAAGVLWAVFDSNVGHLREDVREVRKSVDENTKQVGNLKTELVTFSGRLDTMAAKFEGSVNNLTARLDKFDSAQSAWNDPKRVAEFAEALKKQGIDQPIIIVPFR
jgi:hypothetical protein